MPVRHQLCHPPRREPRHHRADGLRENHHRQSSHALLRRRERTYFRGRPRRAQLRKGRAAPQVRRRVPERHGLFQHAARKHPLRAAHRRPRPDARRGGRRRVRVHQFARRRARLPRGDQGREPLRRPEAAASHLPRPRGRSRDSRARRLVLRARLQDGRQLLVR